MAQQKILPEVPASQKPKRHIPWVTIGLLVIGWLALFTATTAPLLAAMQTGMIGLGAIGTAIVVRLWRA